MRRRLNHLSREQHSDRGNSLCIFERRQINESPQNRSAAIMFVVKLIRDALTSHNQ